MGVVMPNLAAPSQVISEIGGVHFSGISFERSMAYNNLLSTTVQAVIWNIKFKKMATPFKKSVVIGHWRYKSAKIKTDSQR